MSQRTIAVIGGGASGALVCAQLLSAQPADLHIEWIGNEPIFGRGIAYGTLEPAHLLNIPARRMSAFEDRPEHFLEWLKDHHPELGATPESFVPRMLYGEYLSQLVPSLPPVNCRHDEAIDIQKTGRGYRISLKTGTVLEADAVVLALGALSGQADQSIHGAIPPWRLGQLERVPKSGRILLIGTGLTMIDVMLSLRARGSMPELKAISTRGLVPRPHAPYSKYQATGEFRRLVESATPRLSRALRVFRSECSAAEAQGTNWRAVFEEIRPHTPALWARLTPRQRSQFYRHLRPYWDVHRHRLAAEIYRELEDLRSRGILRIQAARIVSVDPESGTSARVALQPRSGGAQLTETFDALIDCTGFTSAVTRVQHPLFQSLISQGIVSPDNPPLGVSVHSDEHPRVHLIGPLLRGSLWESIAIPEIRVQAAEVVRKLLTQLERPAPLD